LNIVWGSSLALKAVAESVQSRFTLFSEDGKPLRARITLALRSYRTLGEQLRDLNLQSPDHSKTHRVRAGDTLALIAYEAYGDAERYAYAYSDQHTFDPGKRLDIRMGYQGRGRMSWMVRGIITDLTPSFPASGPPTLSVGGRNRLHDLLGERRSKVYPAGLDT